MSADSWLLYPTISASMPFQMALDEILFRNITDEKMSRENQKPFIRFYYASEPWISLGYAYSGWKEADNLPSPKEPLRRTQHVPLCRRITGGGRVLHGADLMFTVVAPKGAHESFSSVDGSYRKLHEAVKGGLGDLGHKPEFVCAKKSLPRGKDCFLYPIATDIEIKGEKAAGGGQKRSMGILMHQESIQFTGLGDPSPLIDRLEKNFEKTFHMRLTPAAFSPELFIRAEKLGAGKYKII